MLVWGMGSGRNKSREQLRRTGYNTLITIPRRDQYRMKPILKSLSYGILAATAVASANEATIVGVYENCEPVSSTIFVQPGELDPVLADQIAAQAAADSSGLSFEQALPVMIATLERSGIDTVQVRKQGQCGTGLQGKFVEATATYCGDQLARGEVYVDGNLFFTQSGPKLDYDAFVGAARDKLRMAGILDDPRISLNNLADCQNQQASG